MQQGLVSKLALLTLAFSLSAQAAPRTQSHTDVVGGVDVTPEDPIAHMTVHVQGGGSCSGTIIDQDLVVTAAHCLAGLNADSSVTVTFGLDARAESAVHVPALAYKVHENYSADIGSGSNRNDIALIRIESLPAGYTPAAVLPADQSVPNGETVTVAGFGITAPNSREGLGILRKTDILMDSYEYSPIEVKLDSSHGSSDCNGDSGGPAFVKRGDQYFLIGADNWGPSSCDSFSVYAKVPGQLSWIQTTAEELRRNGSGDDGSGGSDCGGWGCVVRTAASF